MLNYDLDEIVKANKTKRVLENGLTSQEYVQFDVANKALALKLLKIMILRLRTYLLPQLEWITNALYFLFNQYKE